MKQELIIKFEELDSAEQLNARDAELVRVARQATATAYAPYSGFRVAAAARLQNGELLSATNQENASYPIGICAERSLLATIGAIHPAMPIEAMAITYHHPGGRNNRPVTPCGMCRQALLEYEHRTHAPIRLIIAGYEGPVLLVETASLLLPLSFSAGDIHKNE